MSAHIGKAERCTSTLQVDRILRLVLPDPRASPSPSLVAVLAEVQEMRTFGAKKGVFHYRCLDPWERQRCGHAVMGRYSGPD